MAPGPESTDHRQDEWLDYYRAFNYFSPAKVRHFCYPRCMRHPDPAERAVVLVHGLTDSPWFLMAIARHFFTKHGYDVYLPLLHMHGLREPQGMEGVELEEWQSNVRFAIDQAAEHSARVSVGGLSTGGVLSFYMACTKPKVTGDLLPKALKVPHASVVLQTPILSETGEELEPANPQFAAMMQALDAFV